MIRDSAIKSEKSVLFKTAIEIIKMFVKAHPEETALFLIAIDFLEEIKKEELDFIPEPKGLKMRDEKNNTGDMNTGDMNSGDMNSGNRNTGNRNSGNRNTGYWNSGYWNSGYWNSGHWNSGYWNSGHCNAGDSNSGHCNAGHSNSGHSNSGHWNSGNSNSGNRNAGWFNSDEPNARFFNKESKIKIGDFLISDACPNMDKFIVTEWVDSSEMTDEEKKEHSKEHSIDRCGGYLKKFSYKEAWKNFWAVTSQGNKQKFLNLPNFDADIFLEITGIDVRKKSCAEKIVEIDGKKFKLVEIVL